MLGTSHGTVAPPPEVFPSATPPQLPPLFESLFKSRLLSRRDEISFVWAEASSNGSWAIVSVSGDYGLIWICDTGNMSVSRSKYAKDITVIEIITGKTHDISEYFDFRFYDWVTYHNDAVLGETLLGRWLGVYHKVKRLIYYLILTDTEHIISDTNV